ncbi:MAG TPA: lysophospholipid acyltransferase family protein [Gemmatimonadaceae bacterium]
MSLAHRLEYGALRGLTRALGFVPLSWAQRIGAAIATLGYAPLGIRRRVVVRQIAAAFPELDEHAVRRLARRAYGHLGRVVAEAALLPQLGRDGVLGLFESEQGFDAIERVVAEGRGVILITGHLGNWELAGAYVAARGIPIEVIARRLNNPLVDAYVTRTREAAGMRVVYDADAVRRTPRALREGHAVAFVADQGVLGLASTFVPFFGRPAKTPRGAAVFALRFGIPAFFVAAVVAESGRYRCVATPIPVRDTGDREADVDAFVAAHTAVLEEWVRKHPEQYFWHHRRWRRQPPDTPAELRDPVLEESR